MRLTIQFKKKKDKVILNCIREDKTVTWEKLKPELVGHDFMHYAVETTLKLENSFFGLLAKGYTIQDFELPKEERKEDWPLEAIQTEFIVAFLQLERYHNNQYEDFNEVIRESCTLKEVVPPAPISEEQLDHIRTKAQQLANDWQGIPIGEALILNF